jgi:integrase
MGRLTIARINAEIGAAHKSQKAKWLFDGDGLRLHIVPRRKKANASWIVRYTIEGRTRDYGLGSYSSVPLAQARRKNAALIEARHNGIDLVDQQRAHRAQLRAERQAASGITFETFATAYIKKHGGKWRNPKHRAQWTSSLEAYAFPVLGDLPIAQIETVLPVLEPIWLVKPETADRVRQRMETIFDAAKAAGLRTGDNPARLNDHLKHLLPSRPKRRPKHHAAIPFRDLPAFMAELRERESIAPLAFRFLVLTCARTSEITGARWSEVSTDQRLWTVDGERMKSHREHRVPLSDPALAIIGSLRPDEGAVEGFLFPSPKGRQLSNQAFLACLKRMERTDITPHGMRSAFRDWVAETTDYPGEVAEMALAHAVASKVEAAYRRGDLLLKRRELMREWGEFCEGASDGA